MALGSQRPGTSLPFTLAASSHRRMAMITCGSKMGYLDAQLPNYFPATLGKVPGKKSGYLGFQVTPKCPTLVNGKKDQNLRSNSGWLKVLTHTHLEEALLLEALRLLRPEKTKKSGDTCGRLSPTKRGAAPFFFGGGFPPPPPGCATKRGSCVFFCFLWVKNLPNHETNQKAKKIQNKKS